MSCVYYHSLSGVELFDIFHSKYCSPLVSGERNMFLWVDPQLIISLSNNRKHDLTEVATKQKTYRHRGGSMFILKCNVTGLMVR